jgi:hypothetical protein
MFTVKWLKRGKEAIPVETEEFAVFGPEVIVQACQTRMGAMRLKHPTDGFVVFDSAHANSDRKNQSPHSPTAACPHVGLDPFPRHFRDL